MKISFCPPPLYKCIVVFSLALFLSFTLFSCGGLVDDVPDGYGNVRVSFGSSRNVTQDDKDAASVTVYFNGNKIEKKGDVFEGLVESGIKLTITAEAVSGGRIIGKGEETITVKSGPNDVQMKIYTYDNFVVTVGGKAEGYTNFADAWDSASGKTATIKMNADTSVSASMTVSGNITLDLNGHTLRGSGSAGVIEISGGTFNLIGKGTINANLGEQLGSCISVSTGCTFNMYDGIITGGYGEGGGVRLSTGASFNMYGGSITGNKENQTNGGAGVFVFGTFTMYGGSITNNIGITYGTGGGVCIDSAGSPSGTFIMNGGVISGNQSADGGGVHNNAGTFTMNGGIISGNTATGKGGGVYASAGETFNHNGGTISGNTATDPNGGNNVYVSQGATYIRNGVTQDTSQEIIIN